MDKTDAVRLVDQEWREALRVTNGTPVEVDEKLTVEYSWGWVISFVPVEQELCRHNTEVAIDRLTGYSLPVGTLGLENALESMERYRGRQRMQTSDERH